MTSRPSDISGAAAARAEGQDVLRDLYADWSQIITTTPDLSMRLFRAIFDEWHQPTVEPRT